MTAPASKRPARAPNAHRRGVTLIELLVGFTIAILLTLAAVSFAAHETRLMGISRDRLDLAQASRATIELIADDLKQAGAGIGYQSNGVYAGLMMDNFVAGGVQFNPDGAVPTPFNPPVGTAPGVRANLTIAEVGERETVATQYTSVSTDIGIMTANGSYATIAEYDITGSGMFCTAPDTRFGPNELVVFRSQSGFDAFTAVITVGGPTGCNVANGHNCANQCTNFTFVPRPFFQTDAGAPGHSYLGGEIGGRVRTIVWFAVSDGATASLRRAEFDAVNGCVSRDATCGQNVVNNVEAFIAQAWVFDPTARNWINAGQGPFQTDDRIRVDVELVMRSRKSSPRQTMPVPLNLVPGPGNCVPSTGPCAAPQDWGQRTILRTSVEVKNSGHMAL